MNAIDFHRDHRASRGVALLLTLGMLVLLSGIIIAFLSSLRTDLVSSKSYEGSTSARLLADSAVNLVIGQIREASTQPNQAWISQPGLIRTYGVGGAPTKAYKLYSSPSMVVNGKFDPAADAAGGTGDMPAMLPSSDAKSWRNLPALWTDINSPIIDRTTKRGLYPILDGNDLKTAEDPVSKNSVAIFDANGDSKSDVEGFRIEAPVPEAVAMPVRWLYVLRDGTLVPTKTSGDDSDPGQAPLDVPAGKERDDNGKPNPIVARIAFWTDDETSKVNINTASEGTFADTPISNSQPGVANAWVPGTYTPRAESTFEWELAERAGAQKEFQRYPGHPATTSLSPILGTALADAYNLDLSPDGDAKTLSDNRNKLRELIYLLTPRVSGYNSAKSPLPPNRDGTTPVFNPNLISSANENFNWSSQGGLRRAGRDNFHQEQGFKLTSDNDRLYAMIDELLFDPQRGFNSFGKASAKPQAAISREVLERSKFFLTANSKAPEQNLWNQPRVAIWPIHVQEAKRTAFDKLIAFCSTMGRGRKALPFYFTRENPKDSSTDLSARNRAIYDNLVRLTNLPIPGPNAEKTFSDKYGEDKDQILTEIFDYIRCTNLVDSSDYKKSYTDVEKFPGQFLDGKDPPAVLAGKPVTNTSRGQVVPIEIGNTRGIGRIATISELALVIISKGRPSSATTDANRTRLEFSLLPQLFSPMAGYSAMGNDIEITFPEVSFNVKDSTKAYSDPFRSPLIGASGAISRSKIYDKGRISNIRNGDSKIGGQIGYRSLLDNKTEADVQDTFDSDGAPLDSVPPSGELDVDLKSDGLSAAAAPKITIDGKVTVQIKAPASGTPLIVQTLIFVFPPTAVPLPNRVTSEIAAIEPTPGAKWTRGGRFPPTGSGDPFSTSREPGVTSFDTVRSLVPMNVQGDIRLIAATKTVDYVDSAGALPFFGPGPAYSSTNIAGVNSMRPSWRWVAPGAEFGSILGAPYLSTAYWNSPRTTGGTNNKQDTRPPIPEGINGVKNSLGVPGDWDNGPAQLFDGALCNKPDEGAGRHNHAMGSTSFGGAGATYNESAPYIGSWYAAEDAVMGFSTFFSPNRQIPSAVMFGSLPTGVKRGRPWQTLLFRPAENYLPGGKNHPGGPSSGPTDHLLLDLFWMPIVEPYAISEPFATAGKVNLNYQIAPFTHIKRDTGLRAVLKAVKIAALNPDQPTANGTRFLEDYKVSGSVGVTLGTNEDYQQGGARGVVIRRDIDLDNTLKQIEARFAGTASPEGGNRPFISASEICDIPLIPKDVLPVKGLNVPAHVSAGFKADTELSKFDSLLSSFWSKHKLTGDNSLERPYSQIYPRLTTRSNSYTVYVRVQTLQKNSSDPDKAVFKEGRDQVTGEFRGSFLVERYLDANSAGFVDAAGNPTSENNPDAALGPYRFRVVSSKQFAP